MMGSSRINVSQTGVLYPNKTVYIIKNQSTKAESISVKQQLLYPNKTGTLFKEK